MHNKKAVELSINTIIIIIIAIIALIVILLIFSGAMKGVVSEIMTKIKNAFGLWKSSEIVPAS